MPTDFDRFFLNLPPFDRERDFDDFWKKAFQDLKRVPIEPTYDLSSRRSTQRFDLYEVTFRGYNKSRVTGEILYPKGARRAKFAVCLHDYNRPLAYQQAYLDIDLAYFFIRLRGHELIEKRATDQEPSSPGYLVDGILELDNYYAKGVYLDAFRAIDVLRLNSKFDSSEIGMMGKGFGAAAAVFATSFSDRVSALVIDTLAFCCLPVSQNSSTSDATNEINAFIETHKTKKRAVKTNLTYFDAINFADRITCPVLATVGLKDRIAPPECVFSFFNHLQVDKTMEVYPDEGNTAGSENQLVKSIKWMKGFLLEP